MYTLQLERILRRILNEFYLRDDPKTVDLWVDGVLVNGTLCEPLSELLEEAEGLIEGGETEGTDGE